MLRNIFLKTVRDNRWGIAGVGLGLALLMIVGVTQYPQLLSGTGAERARQVAEFTKLMQSFSFLLGEVVPIDTIAGFLTVRILGFVPIMTGLWAVIVAAGLIRGEEELGALDVLLTTPHGRIAVFWQKAAALGLSLGLVVLLIGAGLWAGLAAINESIAADRVLALLLNIGLITAFWGAAGLLGGQLTLTRRTASTLAGGLLFATYVVDNLSEGLASLKGLTWVLPFHYYMINKPLLPGRGLDYAAMVVLAVATLAVLGLALWMFQRRDLGAVFPLLPARRTTRARSGSLALLGSVFAKSLRDLIGSTLGWGLALAAYGVLIVAVANEALAPMRDVVHNMPWLGQMLGDMATNEGFLSAALGAELPLLVSFFALVQIVGWTSDEESGRMEMLVGEPLPRLGILLARYAAIVCSLIGILGLMATGLLVAAAFSNTPLDAGRLVAAMIGVAVVALVVLAFGLAVATWLKQPGAAVSITGGLAIAMFFLNALAPLFNWPEAVRNLSIYYLYGQPLLQGLAWGNMAILCAAILLFGGGSLAGFARRDIAK